MAIISGEGEPGHDSSTSENSANVLRGAIVALLVLVLVLPRVVPLVSVAVASIVLVGIYIYDRFFGSDRSRLPWLAPGPVTWLTLSLLIVLFVACSWSVEPLDGLVKVVFLSAICIVAIVLSQHAGFWPPRVVHAVSQGLVIGMAIGSIYILVDTVTYRSLTRAVHNSFPILTEGFEKHYRVTKTGDIEYISHSIMNRATFTYSVLLWPAILGLSTSFKSLWGRLLLGAPLVVTAACIVLYSTHQSSQLAILVSAAALALTLISLRFARALIIAGVCSLYLLIVPFSLYAQDEGWHLNKNIMGTARARLIFWAYTSERVLEKPFLGVGTNSTRVIDSERARKPIEKPNGYVVAPRTRAHPHNSYLQLWYEVGLLGVLAALAFHLSLSWRVSGLPEPVQRFALAHIVLTSLIVMPSYGLWQTWFQAVVGFSVIMLMIAATRRGQAEEGSNPTSS